MGYQSEAELENQLIKQLKADGCNGLLNLNIIYDTVGPKKGDNVNQVIIKGTGVVFEENDEL